LARILVVGKYYLPFQGGIEENTRLICEYLAKTHDVTVIAHNHEPGEGEDHINGVKIIRRRVWKTYRGQPITFNPFKSIDLNAYNLIHVHSPNPLMSAMFMLRRMLTGSAPVVVTHHMDIFGRKWLRRLSLPFLHGLMRRASIVVVTSAKNLAVSNDLPANANYAVIPLAINPEDYHIDAGLRAEAVEWRHALVGNAPAIGFVGRHARYKGLKELIEAISQMPQVHALIAGDGPYRADIEQMVENLGLRDRVHFIGRVDHRTKLKLLSSIDLFAFPSTEITEAFGMSQMEAMLCGSPVVATNLPTGVTDVAVDEQTALLAEPGDVPSLIRQMRRLLDNPALGEKLATQAREHIMTNMTPEIVARKTLDVFEAAMDESAR
jgi:glycosyltransferase involved in cell wall biosynthesis